MKIEIEKHKQRINRKRFLTVLSLTILAVLGLAGIGFKPSPSISKSELRTVDVQQGNIDVMAPVFGEFVSKYERLISAPSDGIVTEIYLRSGADVINDSIIAKLSNPDLEQLQADENAKLQRLKSEYQTLELQKQSEQLDSEAKLADINNQIKAAELELNANQELAKHGIVAKIEFEKAKLKHQQLLKQQEFNLYRFDKQKQMHQKQLQQKQSQIRLQQQQLELVKQKVNGLNIQAGINGTLQQLNIELGQQLSKSASIAKVGSKQELIVELKIPQRLSNKVKVAALVEVTYKDQVLLGEISQLSSVIENGFILAEVELSQSNFEGIRPSQPVNAYVFVEQVKNTLYVQQKPGLIPLTIQNLYALPANQNTQLHAAKVEFGELSKGLVVIKSGVNKGDKISINDLSQWQEFNKINIK